MAGHLHPEPKEADAQAASLLCRLRQFCLPREDAARAVSAVRIAEQGEMRMSPEARWIPFTAEQTIEARRSSFRWQARLSGNRLTSVTVTDAYENGHGYLTLKAAGFVPLKRITGADVDQGELQRYLASIAFCPPALLNHASLEWKAVASQTLRVRDRKDETGATVDLEMTEEGHPLTCRAQRPRLVGKHSVLTPWWGSYLEFSEWEGLRVASRLEVSWQLPQGPFAYFRSRLTSFQVLR
ncbi:MAG: DUF6544 family protein [Acidobacteriota bacterium]